MRRHGVNDDLVQRPAARLERDTVGRGRTAQFKTLCQIGVFLEHRHWHEHEEADWHADGNLALSPLHEHEHRASSRTALLLILGSSLSWKGIPAFFAASRYGVPQLVIKALVFGACTIATYVILCDASTHGVQNVNLGRFERYGEVLSGALIAALGLVFLLFPKL